MGGFRELYRHAYERKIEAEIKRLGDTIRLWKYKAGEFEACPDRHLAASLDDVHSCHKTALIMLQKMKRTALDEWDGVRPEVQEAWLLLKTRGLAPAQSCRRTASISTFDLNPIRNNSCIEKRPVIGTAEA